MGEDEVEREAKRLQKDSDEPLELLKIEARCTHDFNRRMILKAAAHARKNEEAAAFWAPQLTQKYENSPLRRVRMRSVSVQWPAVGQPLDRQPHALESYSNCDVIFSKHCIWIGSMFHIWHGNTESGRCDGSEHTKAIYSHHAIELCDARMRMGEGCQRHWLSIYNPTAALLMFGNWTATRPMGGYDRVRSFKAVVPYALQDGSCKRCGFCSRGEAPSYSARVVMVLEGSSEPQQYREQMKALMPRMGSSLEWGIPCTMSLRDRRDMVRGR